MFARLRVWWAFRRATWFLVTIHLADRRPVLFFFKSRPGLLRSRLPRPGSPWADSYVSGWTLTQVAKPRKELRPCLK